MTQRISNDQSTAEQNRQDKTYNLSQIVLLPPDATPVNGFYKLNPGVPMIMDPHFNLSTIERYISEGAQINQTTSNFAVGWPNNMFGKLQIVAPALSKLILNTNITVKSAIEALKIMLDPGALREMHKKGTPQYDDLTSPRNHYQWRPKGNPMPFARGHDNEESIPHRLAKILNEASPADKKTIIIGLLTNYLEYNKAREIRGQHFISRFGRLAAIFKLAFSVTKKIEATEHLIECIDKGQDVSSKHKAALEQGRLGTLYEIYKKFRSDLPADLQRQATVAISQEKTSESHTAFFRDSMTHRGAAGADAKDAASDLGQSIHPQAR
jgi:hypothetical protein